MKSRSSLLLLLAVVALTRIPLLFGGYGSDGDAWRIAHTAQQLWNDGIYSVSRFPGFPFYELLQTPVIMLGGSFASNLITLIIFLISIVLFRNIILRWNLPNTDLLLICYSFLPILWKNSAVTMDYIWGLAGILGTILLLLKKRFLIAGIVLGLTAGTRLSYIALLFPLLILFDDAERKYMRQFILWSIVTTILCYLPVLFSNDIAGITQEYMTRTRSISLAQKSGAILYRIVFSLGLLGWCTIGVILLLNRRLLLPLFRSTISRLSFAVVVTTAILFVLIPDEREYLIPAMPFFLILLSQIANRIHFAVITVVVISYGFISLDVTNHDPVNPKPAFNVQQGFVVKEYHERRRMEKQRIQLAQASLPDSSFVMIGMGPIFWYDNPYVIWDQNMEKEFRQDCARSLRGKEIYFIYALKKPQLDLLRQRGYTVYYWSEMERYLETFIGYSFTDEHIQPIQ